jgi:diguanylate cyclase (GGDEF)-like protein
MAAQDPLPPLKWDAQRVQIKGFAAGLHQIEWLLVSLVMLYLVIVGMPEDAGLGLVLVIFAYLVFSLGASRLRFFGERQRWLLAIHTWVMIGFITWFLHRTQGVAGPLTSLYLLAVVTSALTLGILATMLQVTAISACILLLFHLMGVDVVAAGNLALIATNIVTFFIVGYLTSALVHALHLTNRKLLDMANRDAMTGLFNRRAFDEHMQTIAALAKRSGRPYSIIVIDMDGLKTINDTRGHIAGDLAIQALAQRLMACKRDSDLLARYGGDEFVMVLPETDSAGARRMMERLLQSPRAQEPRISIGLAAFPEHGTEFEEVFDHADNAMYFSKTWGGNRVSA